MSSALALTAPAARATTSVAHAADRDCADFPDQATAQRYFIDKGGPQSDPHNLDEVGPGNGVACESLPCPCSSARGRRRSDRPKARSAIVVDHVDGDTIKVRERVSKRRHTVRLLGIDTPETRRPGVVVECGGPEASDSIRRLLPKGARVLLRTDSSQAIKDRYGRLLAYVQRKGRDVGRTQITRGWATTYVYAGKDFHQVGAYRRSESAAERAGRGVHHLCDGDFHKAVPVATAGGASSSSIRLGRRYDRLMYDYGGGGHQVAVKPKDVRPATSRGLGHVDPLQGRYA